MRVGAVANPHIRINANAMGDPEKLEQLHNHELFHEFQEGTLSYGGERELNRENECIVEATANLASALVTNKTTIHGYLNEHTSNAMRLNSKLLSEEMIERIGSEAVGYALFVYLYNYAQNVPNGLVRIADSMYEEDPLEYLNAVQKYDLIATQRETGIKYLNHKDYDNKNLIPDPNFNDGALTPRWEAIVDWTALYKANREDKIMPPIGIDYYTFACDYENYDYTIKFSRENYGTSAYLLGFIDGKYQVVDFIENADVYKYTFKPHLYEEAIDFHLMVINPSLVDDATYSVEFKRKEAVDEDDDLDVEVPDLETSDLEEPGLEVDDAGSVGHISFVNNYPAEPEQCEKFITTFYYNAEGNVCRMVLTYYLVNEEIAQEWYEFESENNWLHIHLEENVLTAEYLYDTVAEYYGDNTVEELYEWKEEPAEVIWYMYGDYIDFIPVF